MPPQYRWKANALTNVSVVGQKVDLQDAPNATAITAIQSGLSKPGTAQTITPADTAAATTAQGQIAAINTLTAANGNGDLATMKIDLTSTKVAANNMATAFEPIP